MSEARGEKLSDVSKFLKAINCNYEDFMVTMGNKDSLYATFQINHKNKNRLIRAPQGDLKTIQKKINVLLTKLYVDAKPRSYVHGFIPGKSIVTNASVHKKNKYVLNFDLKNFFSSITRARIKGALVKGFKMSSDIASMIADISTLNETLPEGAPTSPIISNIILNNFDSELGYMATQNGCKYTRYADDITISSAYKKVISNFYNFEAEELDTKLYQLVKKHGFNVNDAKTRLANGSLEQQQVTGLIVNEKVNIQRDDLKAYRAFLHRLSKSGEKEKAKYFHKARGYLAHIKNVRGSNDLVYGKYAAFFNSVYPEHVVDIDIFLPGNNPKGEDIDFLREWFSKRVVLIRPPIKSNNSTETLYGLHGTGFFIEYKNKYYLVTCEHIFYNDLEEHSTKKFHFFHKTNSEHPALIIKQQSHYFSDNYNTHLMLNDKNEPQNIIHVPNKDIVMIPQEKTPPNFFELRNKEIRESQTVYFAGFSLYNSNNKDNLIDQLKIDSTQTITKPFLRKHNYLWIDYSFPIYNEIQKCSKVLVQRVNGKFAHGDSGGPVINSSGDLVGMVYRGANLSEDLFISSKELITIIEERQGNTK